MSKKHQIIPIGFNLPFAAAIETLSLAVDDFGADCRKFVQEGHFTNLTSKISLFYIPRSCILTSLETSKKALSQAETPISDGQYPPFGKWMKKSLEVLKIGSNLSSKM